MAGTVAGNRTLWDTSLQPSPLWCSCHTRRVTIGHSKLSAVVAITTLFKFKRYFEFLLSRQASTSLLSSNMQFHVDSDMDLLRHSNLRLTKEQMAAECSTTTEDKENGKHISCLS